MRVTDNTQWPPLKIAFHFTVSVEQDFKHTWEWARSIYENTSRVKAGVVCSCACYSATFNLSASSTLLYPAYNKTYNSCAWFSLLSAAWVYYLALGSCKASYFIWHFGFVAWALVVLVFLFVRRCCRHFAILESKAWVNKVNDTRPLLFTFRVIVQPCCVAVSRLPYMLSPFSAVCVSIGSGSCVDVASSDLIGQVVTVTPQVMGANKEIKYPRVKLHRDQVWDQGKSVWTK